MRRALNALALLCLGLAPLVQPAPGLASEHAVVLMYHQVDAKGPASTSIDPRQFEAQLDTLLTEGYQVLPLTDLLNAVYERRAPPKAIAITFDDGYRSVIDTAYPMLLERQLPFTVFVATQPIDKGYRDFLSWQELRKIHESGLAEIAAHSVSHAHLLNGAGEPGWRDTARREIDQSIARIEAELPAMKVTAFAYPYGEWTPALAELLEERDLYGLAQHSGALGPSTPAQAIPRFPLARHNAGLTRFRQILRSRPLPIVEAEGGVHLIQTSDQAPDSYEFTLPNGPYASEQLACYSAAGKALEIKRDGEHFSVSLPRFEAGRNKINCTAPSTQFSGAYHWHARQWLLLDSDGKWLKR